MTTNRDFLLATGRIGYALSGGGGKGGGQAGNVYALSEAGIFPAVISCISVGGLNGVLIATGQYEKMKQIWHEVTDDDVRKERNIQYKFRFAMHKIGIAKPIHGYWSSDPLRELVRETIIGHTTVCDMFIGIVDEQSDTFEHFHIRKGTTFHDGNIDYYLDYIIASATIPIVFEPVYIDGRAKLDGGVHYKNPFEPLSKLIEKSMEYIIGFSMDDEKGYGESEIRDDLDRALYVVGSILHRLSENDFDRFALINELCRVQGGSCVYQGKKRRYYPNHVFRPLRGLSPSRRFHHKFAKADFLHGQRVAESWLRAEKPIAEPK